MQTLNDTSYQSTTSDDLNNFFGNQSEPDNVSDTEDNETIYIVTRENNQMDLFLVVSDQSIREKNALTGRTINKWNMTMLESCERIKSDVLRIRFDTVKRDKKERTYQFEKGHAQRLDECLRNILSKRPLSEMNQIIFRCANCATQFSRERLFRKKGTNFELFFLCFKFYGIFSSSGETTCPECHSTYVIEIKESSSPTKQDKTDAMLEKSDSQSSIGENLIYLNFSFVHFDCF